MKIPPTTSQRRPPRAPAAVFMSISGATLILVAAVALNATQPPPPAIAEFAPQSIQQIKQAPPQQESDAGNGPTASAPPSVQPSIPGGTPTAIPSNIPASRRCYGNPPRQTEDPQSPPCVSFWDPTKNDNGGKTAFGVTKDQITVAWPQTIEQSRDTNDLVKYFNARYEFYGRKIVLVPYTPRGGVFGTANDADMQADADRVHDEFQAFASLAYVPRGGAEYHHYDRLAVDKIVSVDSHATEREESHLSKYAPYEWSYLPAFDTQMRNFAEFICRGLAGRPPVYGGPGMNNTTTPRVFGLVYQVMVDGSTSDRATLLAALKDECNVVPAVVSQYTDGQQTTLQMKSHNVTTIACLCQADMYWGMMPEATKQVYYPEWLVNSFQYLDYDSAGQKYPQDQATQVFGVTFHNKWLSQQEMPWYQAIKEIDPNYQTGDNGYASAAYERYEELLVLASGIQLAGPHLTPESFQAGLFKARFPGAGSGTAPLYFAGGGFGPGDHSMVEDASMVWWSNTEEGYTTNVRRGTFCYIDHAKRYGLGQWPKTQPVFFKPPCK